MGRNLIDSLSTQRVWWPHSWIQQPFGPGTRVYSDKDIVDLIYDMEEYADFTRPFDSIGILSSSVMKGEIIEGNILHTINPSGLLNELYYKPGDEYTYCVNTGEKRQVGELMYSANSCQLKFKMKTAAIFNRIPGYSGITSYEQLAKFSPNVLQTIPGKRQIIDRIIKLFPDLAERNEQRLAETEVEDDLIKVAVFCKLVPGADRKSRLLVSNAMMSTNEDIYLLLFDAISNEEDIKTNMKIVDLFSVVTSMICFCLGMFQLIMTIAANIKDSMWELGVLRSMGCTRAQILRVMIYELVSNTLSAITLGYIAGVVTSVLAIAQIYTYTDMPL